ncbi:right-handed parallel beta-helix repeat-containing protein [Cerasicoccus maritimus]|uniref:right-handed parallel beta-helix repeat-containing protein n=1 Tax=Cerasicoccus maritimus TaxID=490089 RepID=UPI002852DAE3|nr:right-handed parallel beta-helix repeat-containing protein [Cerasicoccus maritimus]
MIMPFSQHFRVLFFFRLPYFQLGKHVRDIATSTAMVILLLAGLVPEVQASDEIANQVRTPTVPQIISSFTVPEGQGGFYEIVDSVLGVEQAIAAPIDFELIVHRKGGYARSQDTVVMTQLDRGDEIEFDVFLGYLDSGDHIDLLLITKSGQVTPNVLQIDYNVRTTTQIPVSVFPFNETAENTVNVIENWTVDRHSKLSFQVPNSGYYALHDGWVNSIGEPMDVAISIDDNEPLRLIRLADQPEGRASLSTNLGYVAKGSSINISFNLGEEASPPDLGFTVIEWAPRRAPLRVHRGADGYLDVIEPENPLQVVDVPVENWVDVPVTDGDSLSAIRQSFKTAQLMQSGEDYVGVRLKAGATYKIGSETDGRDSEAFKLVNAKRIIFDGNGATMLTEFPEQQRQDTILFSTNDCQNIVFADLTVDDVAPPYAIGEISHVGPQTNGNQTVTFRMDENSAHPLNDIRPNGKANGYSYNPQIPGRLAEGSWPHYPGARSSSPQLRATDDPKVFEHTVTRTNNSIKAGNKWLVKNKLAGVIYLITRGSSENITLSGINALACGGGALRNWNTSAINILNCRFEPKDREWLGATSDAVHGRGREGVWIEDTRLVGVCEDIMNTYGLTMLVIPDKDNDDNTFAIRLGKRQKDRKFQPSAIPPQDYIKAGDRLVFFNPKTGAILGDAIVKSYQRGRATLSRPIDGIDTWEKGDDATSTVVYNQDLAARFFVRDSYFADSMRFGIYIKAQGGVIFNNHFEGLASSPIFAANEPSWPEGPPANHLWIQGNTFIHNNFDYCTRNREHLIVDPANISIYTRRLKDVSAGNDFRAFTVNDQYSNNHIKIIGNTFKQWRGMGISVRNARNVFIADNLFLNPIEDAELRSTLRKDSDLRTENGAGAYAAIYLNCVNGAQLVGNQFQDLPATDRPIVTSSNVVYVEKSGNVSGPIKSASQ